LLSSSAVNTAEEMIPLFNREEVQRSLNQANQPRLPSTPKPKADVRPPKADEEIVSDVREYSSLKAEERKRCRPIHGTPQWHEDPVRCMLDRLTSNGPSKGQKAHVD
jgi:hypothetical protein